MQELRALLEYLVKHNQEHAAELADLAKRAQALGRDEAYKHLVTGIDFLKDSNKSLSRALTALDG